MKISTSLVALAGGISLLMVLVGGLGLYGIYQSNQSLKTVYEDRTVPAADLGEIEALEQSNALAMTAALLQTESPAVKASIEKIEANQARIAALWKGYMATYLTPDEAKLAKAFEADLNTLNSQTMTPVLAAMRSGDLARVKEISIRSTATIFPAVANHIRDLKKLQLDVAKEEFDSAVSRFTWMRNAGLIATLAGLAFAIAFGSYMVRTITGQLGGEPVQANGVAVRVGEGDLAGDITLKAGDDHSVLAALSAMQSRLAAVVTQVREAAHGVATASAEIAQGNGDLSQRTEEQASALEQTAASMEELGETVRSNAGLTMQASQMALNVSSIAEMGGTVVGEVVDTMRDINDSSRKIVDIIAVIDGIAFQTNILALNAAVEAARAGEQGRGFAVVASEVRSLAGRSSQAAREIKSLISASVERVEKGSGLVNRAGDTMGRVVEAIKELRDLMSHISVATNEQSAGIAQVGEAVSQMDRATQQNAAMVEEMAAAAASLRSQAEDLVHAVAIFKLGNSGSAAAQASHGGPRVATSNFAPPRLTQRLA